MLLFFRCLSTLFFPCQPLLPSQNIFNKRFTKTTKASFFRCLSTLFFPCQPLFSQDLDFFARLCLWEDPGDHFDDDGPDKMIIWSPLVGSVSQTAWLVCMQYGFYLLNFAFLFCNFALRCTSYVPYPLVIATFHIIPLEKSLSPNWLCD